MVTVNLQMNFDKYTETYEEKSNIVQERIMQVLGQLKTIEKESELKVEEWQSNIALLTINSYVNPVRSTYRKNAKIVYFLDSIKKDILKNINKNLRYTIGKNEKFKGYSYKLDSSHDE